MYGTIQFGYAAQAKGGHIMPHGPWARYGVFGGRFGWPVAPPFIGEGFSYPPMHYRFHRYFPWRRRFW